MPAITATAPGKIILFGEHSVVYGRPAIAAPVDQVRARAVVSAAPRRSGGSVLVQAPDLSLETYLDELPEDHPLALAIRLTIRETGVPYSLACTIRVSSTIPIAAGLGSGAAVSIAIGRALSAFLGNPLPDAVISNLAFEVDKLHHGTPSGIDNATITYRYPIYFERDQGPHLLGLPKPFTIVIGDTGIPSPTAVAVGDLRRQWQEAPKRFETLFDAAGALAQEARQAIESGTPERLGSLMNQNHALLVEMGVSSPELDRLVEAALAAGAPGAKLSGGGRGGNMIALVDDENSAQVSNVLIRGGAAHTITTTIHRPGK